MSNPFKLLVFDWDGTLMDSAAKIVACVSAAVQELGLPDPGEAAIRNIIGLGLGEAIDTLFPEADKSLHERLEVSYRHHYLESDQTPSHLFEGAEESLQALEAMGYLLAVATGKGRLGLNRVLESTGLYRLFHATRCAGESFSKPHPEMLQYLMQQLGVDPSETLMIGDTEYDLQMASNAGAQGLGVSYGVHPVARLWRHNPLGMVHSVTQIPVWLEAYREQNQDIQIQRRLDVQRGTET